METIIQHYISPFNGYLLLVFLDFCSGIACSVKRKRVSSRIGIKGLIKKAIAIFFILTSFIFDSVVGSALLTPFLLLSFSLVELISIVENIDALGYANVLPKSVKDKIYQINKETNNHGKS